MIPPLRFQFPLPRVHTGVHLANGRMGVLVWGEKSLILTFAQNGFWHRDVRRKHASPLTYQEICHRLTSGQECEIRPEFERSEGTILQIGGGRLVLDFGVPPLSANLDLEHGELSIQMEHGGEVRMVLEVSSDRLCIDYENLARPRIRLEPAWNRCGDALAAIGCPPPEQWERERMRGFIQPTPRDEALAAWIVEHEGGLDLLTDLGSGRDAYVPTTTYADAKAEATADWRGFWSRIPEELRQDGSLRYALWKLHAVHHPNGRPATLQGPWMEDHRLPLWSNDYHFNINLQMMALPCIELGLYDHLMPLWRMLADWMPKLRENGERFYGRAGAIFLPHATDDRANAIGSYWQGTIDPVSTAWMAHLAWRAARDSRDAWLKETVALPLLRGSFEAFAAILEPDGDRLRIPVGISPEFGEGAPGTYGENPSFALAAFHRICEDLDEALPAPENRIRQLRERTPKVCLVDAGSGASRFALWEGQDLAESHRHHSHLAGLVPFDILGDDDAQAVQNSLSHWTRMGGGSWSAWGTIWAIQILAHVGWVEGAKAWYRFLIAATENEGKSLSAGGARGTIISWGSADVARTVADQGDHEVMQLDANLGLISAWLAIRKAELAQVGP